MASLSISHVSKTYGDSVALYPTSLEVADGEFCCMLGSSGSGKSTLLRMISGLTEPDQGIIRVSGKDVTHVAVNKRSIGFVFQNYALFPHLSVSSNVAFGLTRKGLGRARVAAKVQEMLTLVGLGGYGDRAPKDLSGGQQQRVALARALVTEPDLLLLDEPLSALDKKIRGEMQRELKRIHRETGLTTVMVTHDQEEAMDLGDQVLLLDGGRVQQHGDPHVLYRAPHNRFVAEFLGAYPLGSGSLTARGAEHVVRVGSVTLPLGAPHADAGTGAFVDVAVRSEEVAVRPWSSSTTPPLASDLDGTLTAIDFFGPFARAVVSVGDLSLTSTMLSHAAEPLVVGGRVHVRVNPQGVHVFDQA